MRYPLPLLLFALLAGHDLPAVAPPAAVSADGRSLETAGGEPFIWIGDTAWELFHRLDREEAVQYLETRSEQGFTLIQAVILAENDGLRTPNAYGDLPLRDLDPTRPNEAYFEHVDFIVGAAAARGLVMGLLPTWGDKVVSLNPAAGPVVFNPGNAASFGRFVGERYRDWPVVWILGGDRNVDHAEARAVWNSMGQAIKEVTGRRQLITFHPRGAANSAWFFHHSDWLDFNLYQSGHEAKVVPVFRYAEASLQYRPRKPFVDGEPAYEDIAVRFWEYVDFSKWNLERVPQDVLGADGIIRDRSHFAAGFIEPLDVRRHAYWNLLAGAAGYTYGNNAVWQMFKRNEPLAIPALTDWQGALRRPGAEDMRHLRALWESRPFSRLRPDQALVVGVNRPDATHRRSAVAFDGSFALVYLPPSVNVTIEMKKIRGAELRAWWFDPREGTCDEIGTFTTEGLRDFTPPSAGPSEDWVLLLDATDADLPPPGNPDPSGAVHR